MLIGSPKGRCLAAQRASFCFTLEGDFRISPETPRPMLTRRLKTQMVIQSLIAGVLLIILSTLNPRPDAKKLTPSSPSRDQHGGFGLGRVFRNSVIGPINSVFLHGSNTALLPTVGGQHRGRDFLLCGEPELRASFLHLVTASRYDVQRGKPPIPKDDFVRFVRWDDLGCGNDVRARPGDSTNLQSGLSGLPAGLRSKRRLESPH
jgi:hypothetical protein